MSSKRDPKIDQKSSKSSDPGDGNPLFSLMGVLGYFFDASDASGDPQRPSKVPQRTPKRPPEGLERLQIGLQKSPKEPQTQVIPVASPFEAL